MIIVLIAVAISLLVGVYATWDKENASREVPRMGHGLRSGGAALLVWSVILGIALLASNISTFIASRNMEVFYNENFSVYVETIEMTQEAIYEFQQMNTISIPVENLKQSTNLSDRILELRIAVVSYNSALRQLRAFNDNPLTNWFVIAPSPDLKYIRLGGPVSE